MLFIMAVTVGILVTLAGGAIAMLWETYKVLTGWE